MLNTNICSNWSVFPEPVTYGVHGETQDPATDYYDNVLDESKAENEANTEGPQALYESVTESGEGKDMYSEQLLGTRFDMCTYFILPHCT